MRKYLLYGLVIAAVVIYSWDIFLFVRPHPGERAAASASQKSESPLDKLIARSRPVRFVEKGRDPFLPDRPAAKTPAKKAPAAGPPPAPKPPDVKVTGLIWSRSSPLAMVTLPDGSGVAARAGQSFGEITVQKIEKNRMLITYQSRNYWITW